MNDKFVIKQVGTTYIFQASTILRTEERKEIREMIKRQLEEGCVFIDARVKLISAEKRFEKCIVPQSISIHGLMKELKKSKRRMRNVRKEV